MNPSNLKLMPLPRSFFERNTVEVAKDLLGKVLVRRIKNKTLVAQITEVEAYLGKNDPAAHASFGRTRRTQVLYGTAGYAYIFHIHRYNCLNVVTEPVNSPGCVLIRAARPLEGLEIIRGYRCKNKSNITDKELMDGPGKLCQALDIDTSLYGVDMTMEDSPLQLCDTSARETFKIGVSKRIGITKAINLELRFFIK